MLNHIITFLTYFFLYLTVILLWAPVYKKIALWVVALIITILLALVSQRINLIGLSSITLLACAIFYFNDKTLSTAARIFCGCVLFVLGLCLFAHLIPGFKNLPVLVNAQISKNGIPFNLNLNLDKTIVGILILGILQQRITKIADWITMLRRMWPVALLTIFTVLILSFLFKFVDFDPKLPSSLPIWFATNLFFVCLAEEAFFRGFIQKSLCDMFQHRRYGYVIAIIISSILFGVAHFQGGTRYIILATVAGVGYGWNYWRTQRIEASILTHFFLNLIHFLFFTYPALST